MERAFFPMMNDVQQFAQRTSEYVKEAVNAGDLRTGIQILELAVTQFETLGEAAIAPMRQSLAVLAMLQRDLCEVEAAAESLDRARSLAENKSQADVLRLRRIFLLPPMIRSREAIEEARACLVRELESLNTETLTIADPLLDVPMLHFFLVYHGLDDRPLMELQGRVLRSICPSLSLTAPTSRNVVGGNHSRGRLRIGFLSTHFRDHTIGKLNAGLIDALPAETFEKVLFLIEGDADSFSEQMARTVEHCVYIRNNLEAAYTAIVQQQLDILYFADIGMDPLTYFLAFYRMAPLQVSTWGHPVTSGLSTIDGFILARDMEPEDGEAHFSERLIRLSRPNFVYQRPCLPELPLDRSFFGLPEDSHLYLCPQAVFKFHPDFDVTLTDILRRDPQGRLVLIRSKYPAWDEILMDRLTALLEDAPQRVDWLSSMPRNHFLSLLVLGDVMLDPFPFCGGNTTLEALSFGIPVVTFPTRHIRGRLTYAFYQTIGVMDCVAGNTEEYVQIAVHLGVNTLAREKIREKILAHCGSLYNNVSFIDELSKVLLEMSLSTSGEE
ncbi:MAG: O-linked N-acetylglucosamine transferase family protein [Planctomycetota bacterium]|jgi:predicted O-linked N-acetylglucosamine transferase (SPINDLY family)